MVSKSLYSIVAVVGIALASGGAWWHQNKPRSALADGNGAARTPVQAASASSAGVSSARALTVEVARVAVMRLTDDTQAVGSLRSRQSVVVRPEVSGRVTQLNFRDGMRVRKGQLLVQLDDQLQRAQVRQSEAELSIALANHKRNQELAAQNFISQRSVDESAANLQVAQARLSLAHATAARLRILAPFDGITGIRTVNVGDYLKDGADVVNIEDMDAVFVDFRLPERFQSRIRRGQQASVAFDALPGRKYSAVIQAIDPLIDANGRSVGVRGCIDNRQLQLRPGMFARINTVFSERENALVIPEEAIVPQGARLFVVKVNSSADQKSLTTQRVQVKVGLRSPGRVEIIEGLAAGDTVVTAGHQRVQRDGTPVQLADVPRAVGAKADTAPNARVPDLPLPLPPQAKRPPGQNPCLAGMSDVSAPDQKPGDAVPSDSAPRARGRNPA
jgi:membrane fusion protein (multidrug efflux system)